MTHDDCPICELKLESDRIIRGAQQPWIFDCPLCGRMACDLNTKFNVLPRISKEDRVRLRGAIRERSETTADYVTVSPETIPVYLSNAPSNFDVAAKARKLLSAIARGLESPADSERLVAPGDYPLAYAKDESEFLYLVHYVSSQGWADVVMSPPAIQINLTPKGWEELQNRPRIDSIQGFVAMSFAQVRRATYVEAIEPAIRDDSGFNCIRVDAQEFNGAVMDEVKSHIRQSRFVVADLTDQRNGVYYEAGFADGLDVPTIWTCSKDHEKDIHFDAKHLNVILWESHEDLRTRLANRIIATIGKGPLEARPAAKP